MEQKKYKGLHVPETSSEMDYWSFLAYEHCQDSDCQSFSDEECSKCLFGLKNTKIFKEWYNEGNSDLVKREEGVNSHASSLDVLPKEGHGWVYRILAHIEDRGGPFESTVYAIHEVDFSSGKYTSYTEKPVVVLGTTIGDIEWLLDNMKQALSNPVLDKENFPNEWNSNLVKKKD